MTARVNAAASLVSNRPRLNDIVPPGKLARDQIDAQKDLPLLDLLAQIADLARRGTVVESRDLDEARLELSDERRQPLIPKGREVSFVEILAPQETAGRLLLEGDVESASRPPAGGRGTDEVDQEGPAVA